jgi:hypothetical protein
MDEVRRLLTEASFVLQDQHASVVMDLWTPGLPCLMANANKMSDYYSRVIWPVAQLTSRMFAQRAACRSVKEP